MALARGLVLNIPHSSLLPPSRYPATNDGDESKKLFRYNIDRAAINCTLMRQCVIREKKVDDQEIDLQQPPTIWQVGCDL